MNSFNHYAYSSVGERRAAPAPNPTAEVWIARPRRAR